jgi:hypothetical protein
MEGGHVRAGDAEREEVARRLRDHCAAGRLSVEELDVRVDRVLRAVTFGELDQIMADLPGGAPTAPKPRRRGRTFWPGITAFHEERHLTGSIHATYATALREIVPRMGLQGFQLVDEIAPRRLRFRADPDMHVTVMFHASLLGGTDVSAFGEAPRAIRKAFAELRD